ncbi:MAG: hypothetical protein Q9Q40_06990 [Acidobacteriota bacterium]|nr:hypothetical protein [Acidobacteriota bacterium]MDQ7088251.1 hypothetical protein [Acidobacteriota bacterium]
MSRAAQGGAGVARWVTGCVALLALAGLVAGGAVGVAALALGAALLPPAVIVAVAQGRRGAVRVVTALAVALAGLLAGAAGLMLLLADPVLRLLVMLVGLWGLPLLLTSLGYAWVHSRSCAR